MNNVRNSDLEQCTKSKLSRVHHVDTLAQPAHTGRAHCAQVGHVVECRVSYRRPNTGLCRRPPRPYRGRVVALTRALVRRVAARPPFAPGHDTKLYRDPIHATHARPYSKLCHSTLLSCRSVVSQPCCAILRHNCCPSAIIQCFIS